MINLQSMIEVREVKKAYEQLEVLKGVDLSVSEKEIVAIVGKSGAGKSTLLHIMGALDKPDTGTLKLDGQSIIGMGKKELAQFRNERIGFIFQFHHLLPEFTAVENVAMPLLIAGEDSDVAKAKAEALLNNIGLGHRLMHRPIELSGGERQRAAIARALVTEPNVVLADEPTGNLDEKTAQAVFEMMLELNQNVGTALVMVTHDTRLAKKMDTIYHLELGSLSVEQ